MSRTDAHVPWWVRAPWYEPSHSSHTYQSCNLPDGPVRANPKRRPTIVGPIHDNRTRLALTYHRTEGRTIMPLLYTTVSGLAVNSGSFNGDAVAVLNIQGTGYGRKWMIIVSDEDYATVGEFAAGRLETESISDSDDYPLRVLETAYVWVHDQATKRGWRVLAWNADEYPTNQRPHFIAAQVLIGSEAFVPTPGVVYADEMTLDQVMSGLGRP